MKKSQGFKSTELSDLNELNQLQAESKVLPGGEYAFEKEGFEEDDFSGDVEGGEDSDPEENWGEVEDFGDEGGDELGIEAGEEAEDFDDTGKYLLSSSLMK